MIPQEKLDRLISFSIKLPYDDATNKLVISAHIVYSKFIVPHRLQRFKITHFRLLCYFVLNIVRRRFVCSIKNSIN